MWTTNVSESWTISMTGELLVLITFKGELLVLNCQMNTLVLKCFFQKWDNFCGKTQILRLGSFRRQNNIPWLGSKFRRLQKTGLCRLFVHILALPVCCVNWTASVSLMWKHLPIHYQYLCVKSWAAIENHQKCQALTRAVVSLIHEQRLYQQVAATLMYCRYANIHCGAKKTAPFYFCNNFVKTFYSELIIGTYILR